MDLNGNSQIVGSLFNNNWIEALSGQRRHDYEHSGHGRDSDPVYRRRHRSSVAITGNLNFTKTGNNALTLTSANTYTGTDHGAAPIR